MSEPKIPPEIIKFLDSKFNSERVRKLESERELRYLQGQLSVVDYLRSISEYQTKNGKLLNV